MNREKFRRLVRQLRPAFQALGFDPAGLSRRELYDAMMTTASGKRRRILGTSTKIIKGEKKGVLTAVLYLAAHARSGVQTCAFASPGCSASCLGNNTGRLVMDQAQRAQYYKTVAFHIGEEWFLEQLDAEIVLHRLKAERLGMVAAIRLNGSSDILWERYGVPQRHPAVMFYDYTKYPRAVRASRPDNYHLTFSLDEREESYDRAMDWLDNDGNVAVVVAAQGSDRKKDAQAVARRLIDEGLDGYAALDGDETDIRFDDEPGRWVVLYAKGRKALQDMTGFVRRFAA